MPICRKLIAALLALLMCLSSAIGEGMLSPVETAPAAESTEPASLELPRNITEHPELDKKVNSALKNRSTVGAALLVAKDGVVVYEHYYGFANLKEEKRITADTYFRTASVSKLISAVGVMSLVDAGKLDLDEEIGTYLGYTVRNPRHRKSPITLRMVMNHTSSLYDGGGYGNGKKSLQTMLDLAGKKTGGNYGKKVPGSAYRYANLNGGMLGVMIEAGSGESILSYMKGHVFNPMGMKATYWIGSVPDPENVSSTYDSKKGLLFGARKLMEREYDDTVNPDAHFRTTAGGVWATGMDLLKVGVMMEQGGIINGVRILKEETVAEMMSSQVGKPPITGKSPYGLNVYRDTTLLSAQKKMVYGHQGMNNAIQANIYYEPESGFVFAFVSNGVNNAMIDHIAGIARTLFRYTWQEFGDK